MTQTASSPRSHQLTVAGHGPAIRFPHPDLPVPGFAGAGLAARLEDVSAVPVTVPESGAGDVLSAVWRTSSYLETVQWELDSAQESLLQAVRKAAAAGVAHDELCAAANLTGEELAAALAETPAGLYAIES
ncbi:hypothetical protein [Arthrobacter sp. C152]